MPAMCAPGFYQLGIADVELKPDNRVVLRHNQDRLAGSSLRMDRAIGNAVRMGGISLLESLTMATVNPARVCRIAGRQRGLVPGEKADLVRFRWNESEGKLTVVETIVAGVTAYSAS
jgi:N-acetylglucosamine-6-phosphate deacetylase